MLKYFAVLFAVCALAASCSREKTDFDGGGSESQEGTGYLLFAADFQLSVDIRNELVGSDRPTGPAGADTRAGNTDVSTYKVEILNAQGELVGGSPFLYGDKPADPIELPVGTYTLKASSGVMKDAAWEDEAGQPTYGAAESFTIQKGGTTELKPLVCRLQSVKVSVAYGSVLEGMLKPEQTSAKVVLGGEHSLVFQKGVTKSGYLKPVNGGAEGDPLLLYLTTVYDGKQITEQPIKVTSNAKAGEWRKITIRLANENDGTIVIVADIETWVYGEQVDVDVQTLAVLTEATIPDENDPDAPKILWPGHSFDEEFALDAGQFDGSGAFTGAASFEVNTKDPIESFTVAFTSDNAALNQYLGANGLGGAVDLATVTAPARTMLRTMGFPVTGVAGVTSLEFALNGLMETLYPDYEGTHAVAFAVTDKAGRSATQTLTIRTGAGGGEVSDPIVWVGNPTWERRTVTGAEDETVEIKVNIPNRIKKFMVKISGALDLDGMMPAAFDLVDPESYQEGLSGSLSGFGFPVGDEVKDQVVPTKPFIITANLLGLMQVFSGDTDFTLTITDGAGATFTKTIQLHVN